MPVLNQSTDEVFVGTQAAIAAYLGTVEIWTLAAPPVNTAAPVVSGDTTPPADLACTTGAWSGSPTSYAYQWQEFTGGTWVDVSGQTASTYNDAPLGQYRCEVIATNAKGDSATAYSNSITVTSGGTGFFGIQTVGDNGYPTSDDRYIASRFYLDRTATITEIVAYTVGSGGNLRGVIWNDVAGEPGSVAVVGGQVTPATALWRTSVVPSGGVTLAPGWYYIGVVTRGFYATLRHNLLAGNALRANNGGNYATPGAWPGSGDYTYESQLSVYANYTY